ncbi:hypothetical protein IV203_033664 [Nitzschia inconspicua]|uniref:Hexosyltransferase n=1 Tax=Nitzschia inconspicua TaxID=303405 RepID=A0A9K3Q777_9STRA|nr:hypothetical protein IV203_033664 [Nitzschia inconspicua]
MFLRQQRLRCSTSSLVIIILIAAALAAQFRVFHRFLLLTVNNEVADENNIDKASLPPISSQPNTHNTKKFISSTTTNFTFVRENRRPNSIKILRNATTITTTIPSRPLSISVQSLFPRNFTAKPKWAYAFLVSGCENSDNRKGYQGFLNNIVVAVQRLRDLGSVADFVLFVQMSSSTKARSLPHEEEDLLRQLTIDVRYLLRMRSHIHETFYAVVQEKFRVLTLVEYDKVLFLDADILPLCNLDYIFFLSDDTVGNNTTQQVPPASPFFKENVIMAEQTEASNAGFFLVTPHKGDWSLLQQVIRQKEEKALTLPWPHFDEAEGWGHVITPPDYWRPLNGSKLHLWKWHAVFADQGLLYYWTKYVKMNVSIVIGDEIEHWSSTNGQEKVTLERVDKGSPLDAFSCIRRSHSSRMQPPPYRDFHHFTGNSKPWEFSNLSRPILETDWRPHNSTMKVGRRLASRINTWRETLLKVQQMTNHNFSVLKDGNSSTNAPSCPPRPPPVGRFSTYEAMIAHIKAKMFFGWQHYERG